MYGKVWPCYLSCFTNSFLYDPANTAWIFEKFFFELEAFYSFKITCILVRHLIYLENRNRYCWWCYQQNLLFNLMVSYLYSFNPSISISENGRFLSHSNIYQYENGHPWRTPHIMVKGSDRKPFFLVLDYILVYATSIS